MNRTMKKTMKTVAYRSVWRFKNESRRSFAMSFLCRSWMQNEILVRVEAAGVGVWDPFEREGHFAKEFNMSPQFPIILGSDGAGTIEAVGEKVSRFKKRDRVYGISFHEPRLKAGFMRSMWS